MVFYKRKLFWGLVGIPTLVSGAYLFLLAVPGYVSKSQIVVYQESGGDSKTLSLGKKHGGTSLEGDYLLSSYFHSMNAFSHLDSHWLEQEWSKGFGVQSYGGLFQGFRRGPENLWRYYKDSVRYHINPNSAVMTLSVSGYSPGFPQALSQKLLDMGQKHLSQLSLGVYQKALDYDEHLVSQQREALGKSIGDLSAYQRKIGILSLSTQDKAHLNTISQLYVKLAELQAEHAVYLRREPKNPQTAALAEEIAQIQRKIQNLRNADQSQGNLVRYAREYALRKTAVKNAEKVLVEDEKMLLQTRRNMLSHEYVVSYISKPYKPVVPTRPHRLIDFLWVFGITLLIYLIVK
jgi:capsule polysaccharide export protein KpsE/RkpR